MATETIKTDLIRIDGDTQPRTEVSMFTVQEYADEMQSGESFPPVDVVYDGVNYWLWDGFHRYHAARKIGREEVEANVKTGTVEDARWLALGANKSHGLRRKNEDKQRAVRMALKLRYAMSNLDIASHVGVDEKTIRNHRENMELTSEIPKSTARQGRDGRTIDTANIGKQQRQMAVELPGGFTAIVQPDGSLLASKRREESSEEADEGEDAYDHTWLAGDDGDIGKAFASQAEAGLSEPAATPKQAQTQLKGFITLPDWQTMTPQTRARVIQPSPSSSLKFNSQGDNDSIEWALWSWNPVTGCKHDCPYCYARDIANRFYEQKFEPSLWPDRLACPKNTPFPEAKAAQWMGHKNVFTCSMADLFGRWVPREWIDAVLSACCAAPQWNFLFLTKFPVRMAEFDFPDNAWVGTTVDCQVRVKNAEQAFRKVKAKVKWLSLEPIIEPLVFEDIGAFDWVVLGGASSSSQTPEWHPHWRWVNSIERQAEDAGVPFYEKTNLRSRVREYPGIEPGTQTVAPQTLRYLPMVER